MLSLAILLLLTSNAVAIRRDNSILFSRSCSIILFSCFFICFNSLDFKLHEKGLGLFSGFVQTLYFPLSVQMVVILAAFFFFVSKGFIGNKQVIYNAFISNKVSVRKYFKEETLMILLYGSIVFFFFAFPLRYISGPLEIRLIAFPVISGISAVLSLLMITSYIGKNTEISDLKKRFFLSWIISTAGLIAIYCFRDDLLDFLAGICNLGLLIINAVAQIFDLVANTSGPKATMDSSVKFKQKHVDWATKLKKKGTTLYADNPYANRGGPNRAPQRSPLPTSQRGLDRWTNMPEFFQSQSRVSRTNSRQLVGPSQTFQVGPIQVIAEQNAIDFYHRQRAAQSLNRHQMQLAPVERQNPQSIAPQEAIPITFEQSPAYQLFKQSVLRGESKPAWEFSQDQKAYSFEYGIEHPHDPMTRVARGEIRSWVYINPDVQNFTSFIDSTNFWNAGVVFPPYDHLDEQNRKQWNLYLFCILENYGFGEISNFNVRKEYLNESAHRYLSAWVKDRQHQRKLDPRLKAEIGFIRAGNPLYKSIIKDL